MKQLIKMSVAVLGVLCGSVSGMRIPVSDINNAISRMLSTAGVNNAASRRPVAGVNNAVSQIPAADVNVRFQEANARIRRNVPIVHQYRLEDLHGWPDLRVSMRINPVSLHGGIGAVNDICAPLNGIPGVDPEFWITVISRRSIQSTQQDAIQFRPQWVRLNDWIHGETVNCSSVSHVRTFFNGWSQRDVFASQGLSLHPTEDPKTMAVSPSCFNLPAQVQNGGSFSVVYHTVCQNINRDIYGIILVYDDVDMSLFENACRRGLSVRDTFLGAPVIVNHAQLQNIF